MKIDFQHVFGIDSAHGMSREAFASSAEKLPDFLSQIQDRGQDFAAILDDEEIIHDIEQFAQQKKEQYDDIVVLGIGGSALGTIVLRDSLNKKFVQEKPRLHILENIDPDLIAESTQFLNLEKTLFLVVSKSGETPEILAQFFYFQDQVIQANLKISDHFVFITDPEKGFLRKRSIEKNIPSFPVPPRVGGRFSVLTSVGLLPAALIGINIRSLIEGAKETRKQFLSKNFKKNLSFQLATVQFHLAQKGKTQNVLMPYATKLRTFSAWFAQLLAESTGKINTDGKNVGLTPLASLGVTDQHSQLQLYAQGPADKLILFLSVEKFSMDPMIPVPEENEDGQFLNGVSFGKLLHTEQQATAKSLAELDRPSLNISIPEISEETLGQLFFLFEGSTAFLGEFLEIDAFDQPGVERSKQLTRESLSA